MNNKYNINSEFVKFYDESRNYSSENYNTSFCEDEQHNECWKVIIADDEEAVHTMTKMVVRNFRFEGKPLMFLSAYSGKETLNILRNNPDTAVVLLDVVMETENAGLEVAKRIREDLRNDTVRIILRTGQSGQAPENEVIVNYDINDYKEKTELSVQKLNTMMISSLRTFRDIVKLKESEKALMNAKVLAEESTLAKSHFLANMSHELRTPLNGILVTAQLLKTTDLSEEQEDYVNMLLDSTKRLLPIVNDVLDFSKLEAGKMAFKEESFKIQCVMESVYKSFVHMASDKNLGFEMKIESSMPKWVCGDSGKLRQILTNLIGNAIKFTDSGKIIMSVEMISNENGEVKFLFSVKDTGIGITKNNLDNIFNVFTQADDSTTRNYGGTGLGLSISKQIVEYMDGEIWVESDFGLGSSFYFTAVFTDDTCPVVTDEFFSRNEYKEDRIMEELSGYKVLIADDDLINRKVITSLLVNIGCEVDIATGGKDVLRKIEHKIYDIILMDVSMPELDGYETSLQIRLNQNNCDKRIPIIATSAFNFDEVNEKCLESGIDGFLPKPINANHLYQMIFKLVN